MIGSEEERHELTYLPVDSLFPNGWNVQQEDEETFKALVDEVKDGSTGLVSALTVVPMEDGTYRIIGGEHRWMAAKSAGLEEVPCMVLVGKKWQDEDLQKFVTVRLNVIQGKINPDKFIKLYQDMVGKYGAEALQGLLGFTDQRAFQKLVTGVKRGMKKSLPKDMADDFDAQAKEAKTVADLQNIIQNLFAKYGDTVQHSFMIFTHGRQDHLYIAMDRKMVRAMTKVVEYCKLTGTDINNFMSPITNEYMREATKRLEENQAKKPEGHDPLRDDPEPSRSQ